MISRHPTTPAAASSPATPPVNHALVAARKQALLEARVRFQRAVAAYREQPDPDLLESIREDYGRFIVGHVHSLTWDEVWELTAALMFFRICIPTVYVLTGWCTPALPDLSTVPVQRPSEALIRDLELHAIFAEAQRRCDAIFDAESGAMAAAQKHFWDWINAHPAVFYPQGKTEEPDTDEMLARLHSHPRVLVSRIANELLCLEPRIFTFTPTAGDPGGGRKDFWRFVANYHRLPQQEFEECGQYHLLVQRISAAPPSARPGPAPTTAEPTPARLASPR